MHDERENEKSTETTLDGKNINKKKRYRRMGILRPTTEWRKIKYTQFTLDK